MYARKVAQMCKKLSVTVRLPESLVERLEALIAAAPLTTRNRILARAVELGLEQVARELGRGAEAGRAA